MKYEDAASIVDDWGRFGSEVSSWTVSRKNCDQSSYGSIHGQVDWMLLQHAVLCRWVWPGSLTIHRTTQNMRLVRGSSQSSINTSTFSSRIYPLLSFKRFYVFWWTLSRSPFLPPVKIVSSTAIEVFLSCHREKEFPHKWIFANTLLQRYRNRTFIISNLWDLAICVLTMSWSVGVGRIGSSADWK